VAAIYQVCSDIIVIFCVLKAC
jgi:amino acid transporter